MNQSLVVIPVEDLEELISKSVANEFQKQYQQKEQQAEQKEVLLTRKETAQLLGVCLATLDNWTREGKIKKYRNGSAVRYNKREVLASFDTLQKYKR